MVSQPRAGGGRDPDGSRDRAGRAEEGRLAPRQSRRQRQGADQDRRRPARRVRPGEQGDLRRQRRGGAGREHHPLLDDDGVLQARQGGREDRDEASRGHSRYLPRRTTEKPGGERHPEGGLRRAGDCGAKGSGGHRRPRGVRSGRQAHRAHRQRRAEPVPERHPRPAPRLRHELGPREHGPGGGRPRLGAVRAG